MSGKTSLQRLNTMTVLSTAFTVLAALLFTSSVMAQPCDPDSSTWKPNHSYTQGSVVFYKDHWYEARDLNIDGEPGITFHWRSLEEVPECDKKATEEREKNAPKIATPTPDSDTPSNSGGDDSEGAETTSKLCVTPEPWRFLHQYRASELANHGGKVWQAIHTTKGDMPGTVEPPSWELVPDHCSMKLNSPYGN